MTPARLGIIIALLATTLLGATGAIVYRLAQWTNQPLQKIVSVSPTKTPSLSTPSSDAVVPDDWKTYSNMALEFSLQYPSTWKYIPINREDSGPLPFRGIGLRPVDLTQPNGRFVFYINVIDNPQRLSLEKLYSQAYSGFQGAMFDEEMSENLALGEAIKNGQNVTISGVQGKKVVDPPVDTVGLPVTWVLVSHGDKVFELMAVLDKRYPELNLPQLFDQILSTFTFLISDPEKLLIDSWLQQNNLNQYGDSKDTMYAGGTPLFDERTGERTDRYDYLMKKFPDRPWND